jgi:thymidylate kinase
MQITSQLLIFEGIMGSGKSTATREFSRRIAASGYVVDSFTEAADPHPVRASDDLPHFFEPWLDALPAELARRSREKWARYVAQRLHDGRVTVMDGQLFHGDLTNLFMMEMSWVDIKAHVQALLDVLEPLEPLVAYFVQVDIERAINTVCDERGEKWVQYQVDWKLRSPYAKRRGLSGIAGLASLYRDYRFLTDALFNELRCRKLTLDTTARDWRTYEGQVAAAL